jgi:hypothetical protein
MLQVGRTGTDEETHSYHEMFIYCWAASRNAVLFILVGRATGLKQWRVLLSES